jgi:hypothetical protein
MLALLELQRAFATALRDAAQDTGTWAHSDGLSAAARLRVYRNNAQAVFDRALESTFPVVRERVGPDYFRQLAHFYRQAHPSTVGDLHEVGRQFADFLRMHLVDSPYTWLAELAALEWAIAESGVAAESAVAEAADLVGLSAESVAGVRLRLVPSLQCISARAPVLSVWRANQPGAVPATVDLGAGPEFILVHRTGHGVQLRGLQAVTFAFVAAIVAGATLEAAVDESELPLETLPTVLHLLFADQTVAAVIAPSPPGPSRFS